MMLAASTDWTGVFLALIAATPGIIAAIYAGRVHRKIQTPSGEPLGKVAEYTHDTAIANNMLLSKTNGPTKPLEREAVHDAGREPPWMPDDSEPEADEDAA